MASLSTMFNKIFFKVGIVVVLITLIYILFISFVITPKISSYLVEAETNAAKNQLDKVMSIIEAKENSIKDLEQQKVQDYKNKAKNITSIAYAILESNYKLYENGKISKQDAIKSSIDAISNIEYGLKGDYLYVLNKQGKLLYHPNKTYKNKNIIAAKDKKGQAFVETIIKNSIENKETFTKYSWFGSSNQISEKIVHSLYFEAFDLIVSTTISMETIEEEIKKEKQEVLDELNPLIRSIILGNKGYIFIFNDDNMLLLHPNKNILDKNVAYIKNPVTKNSIVEELKQSYKNSKTLSYMWNTPDDLENYIYEKVSWVRYNEFFSWYVISSIYEDDLKTKSKEIKELTLNISVLLLLVLLCFAIFFIQRLLKPITILSQNAQLVKSGKFDIRNNIKTNDEIGILATQFNSMLDFIEDNIKNLENKVEKRTQELENKLYFDELTGLRNRFSLNKDLNKDDFYALSLVDIDEFNSINELYGFEIGNEVLKKVTVILEDFAKENQMEVYKLNSDIFALVDKDLMRFSAYEKYLKDLIEKFKNTEIHIKQLDLDIYVYITIGCTIAQDEPVKTANIALKKAKQDKTRYIVYCREIDTKECIKNTMYWREKIKDAIEFDKIVPFYQPIYNSSGNIVKYETLMRISEDNGNEVNYLSPGYFLDIAMKTKQYFKLNQLVIEKSLQNLPKTKKDISFNISFSDILNLEFVDNLRRNIKKLEDKDKQRIIFEILESDFISDYKVLEHFIQEYRTLGIRIAIDDFGTGYSNFSHIMKIKPDYIKIDGSLIKNLDKDTHSLEIVKSIINFSHSLGIKVIAEFIHSKKIYDIVLELQVDEFQGFYLGEPSPLIE